MKIINVGLIGYGKIGKVHNIVNQLTPIILEQEGFFVNVKKIYSRHKVSTPFVSSRQVQSFNEILQDLDIDLVDVCTPNFTHKEFAIEVIQNHKAIYLEKPLALSYEDAQIIADEARKANIINQIGLIYRFMPGLIGIKEIIQNGEIGEIINFRIRALHSSYLDEKRPTAWNLRKSTSGGGPILDLGIHLFDAIRFVMGEVKEVVAYGDTLIKKRPKCKDSKELVDVDVEDWGIVQVQLEGSGYGTVEVSRVASLLEEETSFEIMGTRGSLCFDVKRPWIIEHYDQEANINRLSRYNANSDFGKQVCRYYPQGNMSMGWFINAQFACLLNCYYNIIAEGVVFSETPTFDEGLKAQAIVEACYTSLQNQSRIQVVN